MSRFEKRFDLDPSKPRWSLKKGGSSLWYGLLAYLAP
jgi:hypothetical protein